MPIINQNVQAVFGTGDISVGIGVKDDGSSGAIEFVETEPRKIGKEYIINKKNMKIGEAPATFIFNEIESLDAVIYQMQKLRSLMEREDN